MSLYQDPESRSKRKPEPSAPLFEQSFYKFEQQAISVAKECFERAHARRNDPATSKKAAASVTNLGPTRDRIIRILKAYGPKTDEQLIDLFHIHSEKRFQSASDAGIRSRRAELVRMGFVEACGEGKTVSGRPCQIWRLK